MNPQSGEVHVGRHLASLGICCPVHLSDGLQSRPRSYLQLPPKALPWFQRECWLEVLPLRVQVPFYLHKCWLQKPVKAQTPCQRQRVLKSPRAPGAHLGFCTGSSILGPWGTLLSAETKSLACVRALRHAVRPAPASSFLRQVWHRLRHRGPHKSWGLGLGELACLP